MTKDELEVIKARCEKATPTPWECAFTGVHTLYGNAVWRLTPFLEDDVASMRREDAEFIAHAREDIPALVAEVENLQRLLDAIQGSLRGPAPE